MRTFVKTAVLSAARTKQSQGSPAARWNRADKAITCADLWSPDKAVSTEGVPTYAEANVDHTGRDYPLEQVAKWFDDDGKHRLYDD